MDFRRKISMQQLAKSSRSASTLTVHFVPNECPHCNCQRFDQQELSAVDKLLRRQARFQCAKCFTKTIVTAEPKSVAEQREEDDRFLNGGYEYLLGNKYRKGVQVPKDYKKAFEHYLASAQLGNPNGQYNAGVCYQHGRGVDADFMMAYYWVGRAAEKGQGQAIRLMPELEAQFNKEYA